MDKTELPKDLSRKQSRCSYRVHKDSAIAQCVCIDKLRQESYLHSWAQFHSTEIYNCHKKYGRSLFLLHTLRYLNKSSNRRYNPLDEFDLNKFNVIKT